MKEYEYNLRFFTERILPYKTIHRILSGQFRLRTSPAKRSYANAVDGNMASVAAPLISSVVDAVSRIPKCCGVDQVFNSSAGYGGKLQPSLHLLIFSDISTVQVKFQNTS